MPVAELLRQLWAKLAEAMGAESHKRGGSGSGQPAEKPLRGIARLVNPPEDDLEAISREEDQAERAY